MSKTGEAYTTARAQVRKRASPKTAPKPTLKVARTPPID